MMERSHLERLSESILETIIAHPPSDPARYILRVTSGTSGSYPLVLATEYSASAPEDIRCKNLLTLTGSRSSRMANAFIASRPESGERTRIMSLDMEDLKHELGALLADYEPDLINAFPSFLALSLTYFPSSVKEKVQCLKLFGETLSSSFEQKLRDAFPRAKIDEMYMALEVGGYIANRFCPHLPRGYFHPARGVKIEIENADKKGEGDILISKAIFQSERLERYRVGDVGRIVPGVCACGATMTLELLGRRDIDRIKIGGALLSREEFDRAISSFAGLIDDYRVEVLSNDRGVALKSVRLLVCLRAGPGTPAFARELADKISRSVFVTQSKTFRDLVDEGTFAPLAVEFSKKPFERGHKDVKLRVVRGV